MKLRSPRNPLGTLTLWGASFFLLCGCERETTLYAALEERQANTVMAALADVGITTHKAVDSEGQWSVSIPETRFAEAVTLLERQGLPSHAYRGVSEVFRKTGMVSSPSEERIRFMDALSQDIAQTLSTLDGVIEARVHIVLPENDPFSKQTLPSSAAVAIRHRWDADMSDRTPQIKGLVKHAIEGLTADKIYVTLFREAPPPQKSNVAPPPQALSREQLLTLVASSGAAFVGAALLLIITLLYHRREARNKGTPDER